MLDVLRSDSLACGPVAPAFEQAFAERVGTAFAVACSSGTAGLHVLVLRLGLGPGDEVITSSLSFVATRPTRSSSSGRRPSSPRSTSARSTSTRRPSRPPSPPRTRAIIPVHIFGYPCDIEAITAIAQRHGLAVIEDACEAIGCTVGGQRRRHPRQPGGVGVLPQQAAHHRRGRRDHHRRPRPRPRAAQPRQPGPVGQRRLARAPAARVQLPHGRDVRRRRAGPAREARHDAAGAAPGGRALRRAARRDRRGRAAVPRPRSRAAGSSTTCGSTRASTARPSRRRWPTAASPARPYLPAIHPQPTYRERFGYGPGMLPVTERVCALDPRPAVLRPAGGGRHRLRGRARCARCWRSYDGRRSTDGVPGLWQIRARRPHLRDGADRGRRPRRRPPHAACGSTGWPSR